MSGGLGPLAGGGGVLNPSIRLRRIIRVFFDRPYGK